MDISNYLGAISLPTENEELLKKFVSQKENDIKDVINQLWNEFEKTESLNVEKIQSQKDDFIDSKDVIVISNDEVSKLENPPAEIILDIVADVEKKTNGPENQQELTNENKMFDAFSLQIKNKNIILPNGKANQPYKFLFRIEDLGLNEIGEYWFEGLEETGLSFDATSKEISGTPQNAGDHKIRLRIKRSDWVEGKPIFVREIMLIINPDPKTLWRNIPTAADIEYFKPDSDKHFVKVEASSGLLGLAKNVKKDIVAASKRGRSHAQEGKPRDDDFALKYIKENDWYILTVADGAGSAKSSRKGSEIVCKTVIDVCESLIKSKHQEFEHLIKEYNFNKSDENRKKTGDVFYGILAHAVFKSLKNIEEEAKLTNKPVKDFATTLIVSICKKFKFGWFVGAFWVGDGGIGIYNKETQFLKVLGESDGGEFAGQTRFLTMPEITQPAELYRRLRFDIVDDFTALILMTDGITDPKFETDANLLKIEKWNDLWNDLSTEVDFSDNNEASADQLLKWLDFWSPGNHDDRTIAILF